MNASVADIVEIIESLRSLPYGDEPVDQREHALQAAGFAIDEGAEDTLVVAAALHDIGRAAAVRASFPDAPHEESGGLFCESLFGERVAWLVRSHVPSKRYLVATDADYSSQLSLASTKSLEVQGGAMTDDEVAAFREHTWADDAIRLRRWDDGAKVPGAPAPEPADLIPYLERTIL